MAKFTVTVFETVRYQVVVASATAAEAEERAVDMVVDDPDRWFVSVDERDALPGVLQD